VLSSRQSHCESYSVHVMNTETAPGGCRPLDQANRLEPQARLYRQPVNRIYHRHLLSLLSPKADTHFTIPRRVEGWVEKVYLPIDDHPPSTNWAHHRVTSLNQSINQLCFYSGLNSKDYHCWVHCCVTAETNHQLTVIRLWRFGSAIANVIRFCAK